MVLNRGLAVARLLKTTQAMAGGQTQQSIRHGGGGQWVYRAMNEPTKKSIFLAEAAGGLMWWWILWHVFTEPGHLIGEFPYPEPEKWTDAELGIPPDDE